MTGLDGEAAGLAARLVAIPSENPGGTESACSRFVADWLAGEGLDARLHEVRPGRCNVVARAAGAGLRPPVALLAHLDTVPAGDGWSFPPFCGRLEGGRLLGRGAADMKAGLAAAMVAFREAARGPAPPAGDVLLCATVDEEGPGMLGVMDLLARKILAPGMFVVATEPSGLCLCPAHKGVLWYEVEVRGRRAHAGNAALGVDSNKAAARVISALSDLADGLPYSHGLLGKCTLTIGELRGGEKINVVPDRTVVKVDFRTVPPLDVAAADRLVADAAAGAVAGWPGASASARRFSLPRPPVATDPDAPLCRLLAQACRGELGRDMAVKSFPAYTDAAMAQAALGLENAVVFGPGELEDAHTVDESADAGQIGAAARVLAAALRGR